MKIPQHEMQAIRTVVELGGQYGYGNLMAHLQSAWMSSLMEDGLSEDKARNSVIGREPYPVQMHEDLRQHGEWDETGSRYRTAEG